MPVDPDKKFSDASNAAVKQHQDGVKQHNEKLRKDLSKTDDPDAKREILAAFDEKIQPVRDAYHEAVEKAAAERDK